MKITVEQMENVEYRKERLLSKTKRLEYLLSGRNRSLLPEVQTEEGKHSEKKTWEFIRNLIGALEKYEKCHHSDEEERWLPIEEINYELSDAEKCFYENFLYCAIRASEENPWWAMVTRGNFDDLLKMAEKTQYYENKYGLFFQEIYKYEELDGFFFCMDELYKAFTGKVITDKVSQEEIYEMKRHYAYELEMMGYGEDSYWEEYHNAFQDMSQEEIAQMEYEMAEISYETMSREARAESVKEAERLKKEEDSKRKWVEEFAEKELFCEKYEQCRELYFKLAVRPWELALNIERMIDVYLYEQEVSCFMNDDIYFYAYTLLDKTIKKVNELLVERE